SGFARIGRTSWRPPTGSVRWKEGQMKQRGFCFFGLALAPLVFACSVHGHSNATMSLSTGVEVQSDDFEGVGDQANNGRGNFHVEDIYVVRTVRVLRTAPTAFCDPGKTGIGPPSLEDTFEFHSIGVSPGASLSQNASGKVVGSTRACYHPNTQTD